MTDFWKNFTRNWQDSASLILGLWLIASPWMLGFAGMQLAMWNAVLFGALITIMALMALVDFHEWEEWTDLVIGAWLIVSPWILGFAMIYAADGAEGQNAATWNVILVGALTIAMATWSLFDHRHHTHA